MKLAPEFHDGMILPADKPFKIYGEAENAITISIDFSSGVFWPTDGSFELELPAHKAGGPYTMFIECNGVITKLHDICFK